jgi:hypothetical protein
VLVFVAVLRFSREPNVVSTKRQLNVDKATDNASFVEETLRAFEYLRAVYTKRYYRPASFLHNISAVTRIIIIVAKTFVHKRNSNAHESARANGLRNVTLTSRCEGA